MAVSQRTAPSTAQLGARPRCRRRVCGRHARGARPGSRTSCSIWAPTFRFRSSTTGGCARRRSRSTPSRRTVIASTGLPELRSFVLPGGARLRPGFTSRARCAGGPSARPRCVRFACPESTGARLPEPVVRPPLHRPRGERGGWIRRAALGAGRFALAAAQATAGQLAPSHSTSSSDRRGLAT